MKAMDVIERLDLLEPNQYSPEQKLRWLSVLDGKVYEEIVRPGEKEPAGFREYVNGDEQLLIPFPSGEDVYYNYLQAMIALENSETQTGATTGQPYRTEKCAGTSYSRR